MRIPPIGSNCPGPGEHWWNDHHCHDHVGHGCHGFVDHCCHDHGNRNACGPGDYGCHEHWLCRWPVPRNTTWEGKPPERLLPANWHGGIGSTGENMSLSTGGVVNVDVYTRHNHTWHTGTVLAHVFSLGYALQRMHRGLHHLRVGTVDQLQQAAQAPAKPAADAAPAAPVPQPIDPPIMKAAPPVNADPGAVLDVRV